jgi:hypothetical protein
MQTLTDKEIETLLTIANKGPITGYDLHLGGKRKRGNRKAIISSAHWLKVKKSLGPEEKNLIRLVPKQAKKKYSSRKYKDNRGRRKDVYDLTLLGWIVVSGEVNLGIYHISRMIEVFEEDIPLIFGEWEYFKKEGVEEIARKHLENTMKKFYSVYLSIVSIAERRSKKLKRENPDFSEKDFWEEFNEEMLNIKTWVKRLTENFLYFGLYEKSPFEHELTINKLSQSEKNKLQEVFNKKTQLYLYRTKIFRFSKMHESKGVFSRTIDNYHPLFDRPIWDEIDFTDCTNKLLNLISYKISEERNIILDPFVDIVDSVYNEEYYFATLKLWRVYENYFFICWEEYFSALFNCMYNLATVMDSRTPSKDKKPLETAILEILATLSNFDIETVQVWDTTLYRMKTKVEKVKKNTENWTKVKSQLETWGVEFSELNDEQRKLVETMIREYKEQEKAKDLRFIKSQVEQLKKQHSDLSLYDFSLLYIRKKFEKSKEQTQAEGLSVIESYAKENDLSLLTTSSENISRAILKHLIKNTC